MHTKTAPSLQLPELILVASLTLAGCATQTTEVAQNDENMICTRETRVGTNFPVVQCRTKEQVERERADVEQFRNSVKPSMPTSSGATGN